MVSGYPSLATLHSPLSTLPRPPSPCIRHFAHIRQYPSVRRQTASVLQNLPIATLSGKARSDLGREFPTGFCRDSLRFARRVSICLLGCHRKDIRIMEGLSLHLCDDGAEFACSICCRCVPHRPGPRLFVGPGEKAVCRECARKLEPRLVNLLDLADMAEKIGRTNRPLLTPPMEVLLELARAAENYNHAGASRPPNSMPGDRHSSLHVA